MKKLMVLLTGAAFLAVAFGLTALADEPKPVKAGEGAIIPQQPLSQKPQVQPPAVTAPAPNAASSAAFQLNWLSINGGGAINASSASYQLGLSVGQSVAGYATSASYQMGIGFWYGAGAPACANIKGDMNGDVIYTAADVVLLLNCAFTGAGSCDICFADVNCDGILTAADVVLELNKAFAGTNTPPWCGP